MLRRQMPHLRENDLGRLWSPRRAGPPNRTGIAVVSGSPEGIPRALVAAFSGLITGPTNDAFQRCSPARFRDGQSRGSAGERTADRRCWITSGVRSWRGNEGCRKTHPRSYEGLLLSSPISYLTEG